MSTETDTPATDHLHATAEKSASRVNAASDALSTVLDAADCWLKELHNWIIPEADQEDREHYEQSARQLEAAIEELTK